MADDPAFDVFTVRERKGKKPFWHKIGVAWKTKGDGLNVTLDSLPLDGRLAFRVWKPREEEEVEEEVEEKDDRQPVRRSK